MCGFLPTHYSGLAEYSYMHYAFPLEAFLHVYWINREDEEETFACQNHLSALVVAYLKVSPSSTSPHLLSMDTTSECNHSPMT